MNILQSYTYQSDLELVAKNIDTNPLIGKKILITGASGLIGSALIDLLIWLNLHHNTKMDIYAAGRNPKQLAERFDKGQKTGVIPTAYDALQTVPFDFSADYVVHGAGNSSPDLYVSQPVDTIMGNVLGLYGLLQYASDNETQKMIYISSSEVYGKLDFCKYPIKETEIGWVDFMDLRSSYPVGKRAAESLCISYAHQYGSDISVVRPGHIYGPTSKENDRRVSSFFAWRAARGEDITLKSAGNQIRSYCYCLDCATAILTVLMYGQCMEVYNISNRNSVISIKELADLYSKAGGVQLKKEEATAREKEAFNPMDRSDLDGSRLESLGWRCLFNADIGTQHTVKILQECMAIN